MSNVVSFQPDRRRRAERDGPPQSAEIVFFTGVRYVRVQDAEETGETPDAAVAVEHAGSGPLVERLLA